MLTAVLQAAQRQQLQQALRFWRLYTACCTCERLKLQLPAYTQECEAFDAWLWRHEQRQHMQQQAAGLAGRLGVLRCFGETITRSRCCVANKSENCLCGAVRCACALL
jgi:hypothetical protein